MCAGKKGNLPPCPGISEECRRDAVALHENNEDLSLKSASTELGINQASLYSWVKKYVYR
ncbi:transposase [Corynebacterium propinquum]